MGEYNISLTFLQICFFVIAYRSDPLTDFHARQLKNAKAHNDVPFWDQNK